MIQLSPAARLASLAPDDRSEVLRGLDGDTLALLPFSWPFWARPDQLPPPGDWRTWLLLGGRGSGKTRSAAEWCRAEVESGRRVSLGVVSPTSDTARRDMIEGPSGLLSVCPPGARPVYESTLGRITWPSGAVCYVFSGEEPDRIRGPNLDGCWIDELCSMPLAQHVFDMVSFATRIPGATGLPAQIVVTTTPRPIVVLKQMIAAPDTVITRSRTMDNAANLDAATLRHLQRRYAGTTLGRQELDAEILDDVDGALWNRAMLDATRLAVAPDNLTRIVVAIDPGGGSGSGNAETGIIVAGRDFGGHGFILQDASGRLSPERWATRAIDLFNTHRADRIIAEQNYGGAMVENTIRTLSGSVPIKLVQATRGKAIRAEPVVSLYEQRKIHHVGIFPELEDQLCQWVPGSAGPSPDRLDAMVWAVSDLLVSPTANRIETYAKCAGGEAWAEYQRLAALNQFNYATPRDAA